MSPRAALLVLGTLGLTSAGLLAYASRAPASLRLAVPPLGATNPDLGPGFDAEQTRRAAAYNRSSYVAFSCGTLVRIALLCVLALGPWQRLVHALERAPGGWAVRVVILACALVLLSALVTLPLAYVRGFVIEHAWGLSTQSLGAWAGDRVRSLAVGAATAAVAALVFFGVLRWQPRAWWLWAWGAFTLVSFLMVLLWPIIVAPLFNRFTALADPPLAEATTKLAQRAGVDVGAVLVADASRRTTAQNAYVAGLGGTKRLVLYDTLLNEHDGRATLWVVGHELGHARERHVLKGAAVSAVGLFAGLGALAWLGTRAGPWAWAGAEGPGDLAAVPVLLLFVTLARLVAMPLENAVARSFERRADTVALELTGDPETAVRVLRRLALRNIADLDPPRLAVATLYSHPPIPDRIRFVLAWAGRQGVAAGR
jgi:STE24 endopeptidase